MSNIGQMQLLGLQAGYSEFQISLSLLTNRIMVDGRGNITNEVHLRALSNEYIAWLEGKKYIANVHNTTKWGGVATLTDLGADKSHEVFVILDELEKFSKFIE